MEKRISVIAIAAVTGVVVIIIISLVVLDPWKGDPTMAERAIIKPGDISETEWTIVDERGGFLGIEGASSSYQVIMSTNNITAYILVSAFETVGQARTEFYDGLNNLTFETPAEPLMAGDEGALIKLRNGNGTCSLFFYQQELFVWIDLVNWHWNGGQMVKDEFALSLALELCDAQEMKFSSVLDG